MSMSVRSVRRASWLRLPVVLVVWLVASVWVASSAHAANLTVTTTADTGHSCTGNVCTTLRAAISKANTNFENDTITLGAGTFTIADPGGVDDNLNGKGDFDVYQDVTIVGASSSTTILSGGDKSRVFDIHPIGAQQTIHVTLRNLTIRDGYVAVGESGSAIYNRDELILDGCVVTENGNRSALVNLGSATLTNTSFSKNAVADDSGRGAAIFNQGALSITNGSFTENASQSNAFRGGAIYFDAGVANIDGTTFADNVPLTQWVHGGALYLASSSADVTLSNVTFTNNRGGGGLYVDRGGAIFQNAGTLRIDGGLFQSNFAAYGGSAIYAAAGTLQLTRSELNSNSVSSVVVVAPDAVGGAIAIEGGVTATIDETVFLSNRMALPFASNFALAAALAVHDLTGSVDLTRCTFRANLTTDSGAAVAILEGDGPVRISSSAFVDNSADGYGGAIYVRRTNPTPIELASVSVVENSSNLGTAVIGIGGGVYAELGQLGLRNSVIANNHAVDEPEFNDLVGAGTSFGYNVVPTATVSWLAATDIVGIDPGLILDNQTKLWIPTMASYLVDGANPSGCVDPLGAPLDLDLYGRPRIIDGNLDTVARCDIGAVELDSSAYISVTPTVTSVAEGTNLVLTLTRVGPTGSGSVTYETEDDGAVGGVDYTSVPRTATNFSPSVSERTITIPILQNTTVDTQTRRFWVRFSASGYVPNVPAVLVTILDDEANSAGRVDVVTTAVVVTEGTGSGTTNAVVTLRRSGGSTGTISVDATRVSGTAIAGRDFDGTTTTSTVSWANGDTSDKTVTIPITRDTEDEGTEQFTVELSRATGGATIGASVAIVSITDDDMTVLQPGTVALASATYSVNEAAGTVTVTAVRSGGGDGVVTIDYATTPGTATAPDFTSAAGTLRWENGEQGDKSVVLTIKDDATDEADETFTFALQGGSVSGGATLGSPLSTTITIVDDDTASPPGHITFSAATYQVNEQAGMVTIQVRRVQGSSGAIDVQYYTTDGTATAPDYTPTSGTLHWDAGDTAQKVFSVAITNDTAFEGDETFGIVLDDSSSPGPVTFDIASALVTIKDNDPAPTQPGVLSLATAAVDVAEGKKVAIVVSRTGGSDGRVTVQCATTDGTAVAPSDYTALSKTLVWNDGDATDKTCAVATVDDNAVDPGETFGLTLSNASGGATLGTSTATVTILDDESAGTFSFSTNQYNVTEGSRDATIVVRRRGGSAGAATVNYAAAAGTAGTSDFVATSGTLRWEAGDAADKSFTVAIKNDAIFESGETVNLTLSSPTGATLGAPSTAQLFISDDDPTGGTIEVVSTTYAVAETTATVTVQVRRSGSTVGATSIAYATLDETATAGSDYTAATGTLSWASGVGGTQDIILNVTNDAAVETAETFALQLASPTGNALLGRSKATVTILDNDSAASTGTVVLSATTYSRREDQGRVTITATRATGSGAAEVFWQTAPGTASADLDYRSASGRLSWADSEHGDKTITVDLIEDAEIEGDETFTVSLFNASITIGAPSSATVTIKDDEAPPATNGTVSLTATSFNVSEASGNITIPVARTDGSTGAISVKCTAVAGTASAPGDFSATNATLSWANGDTATKNCTIPINNDVVAELGEVFTVTLTTPTGGAVIGAGIATVSITDDDTAGRVTFAEGDYTVAEEGGSIAITLVRNGGSQGAVSVKYTTQQRSATAPDFVSTSAVVSWADGDAAPKTFTVDIKSDLLYEGDEDFNVRLTEPTGGVRLGTANQLVTIIDDDPPAGWLSLTKAVTTATELDGTVTLQVSRKGTLTGPVSVSFATQNQTATAGADYVATTGTLNWGDTEGGTKNIVITLTDDSVVEGTESFQVRLTNATGGAAIDRAVERVDISDVEGAGLVSLDAVTYFVSESASFLTITATRTAAFGGAVSVAYATSNGTATQPGDYGSTSGTLSWTNGESGAKTFQVPIVGDTSPEGDETFTITLSNPTGGVGVGNSPATVTITDDDPFPDMVAPPADLLSVADLTSAVDLSTVSDLATSPDLTEASPDLAAVEDLADPNADLTAMDDLSSAGEIDLTTPALNDLGSSVDGAGKVDADAVPDLAASDLATQPAAKSGCGCNTTPSDSVASFLGALLVLAFISRRRVSARA